MRAWFILAALGLVASASANGAMGLGLEMFELNYWFAYVGVTVVLEAWLIGRWLGQSWPVSLGVSIVANLFTGVLCGGLGCLAPFLHTIFVGDPVNPNLLLNAVALLLIFALPSGLLEAVLWVRVRRDTPESRLVKRSLMAHLATVPVGLAILLIPEEPYQGAIPGRGAQRYDIVRAVEVYIAKQGHAPTQSDPKKLIEELRPYLRNRADQAIYGLFRQDRSRFNTGENWKFPAEVNKAVLGKKVATDPREDELGQFDWFLRLPSDELDRTWTVSVDFIWGDVTSEYEASP